MQTMDLATLEYMQLPEKNQDFELMLLLGTLTVPLEHGGAHII